jgi:hypothetical protein
MAYVGVDLFHFDATWQWWDHPYSRRFPPVEDADVSTWDRHVVQPERLPNGLLPIVAACRRRGMELSLWFDACGSAFVREGDQWAVRRKNGQPMAGRRQGRPRQSLASEYGDRLEAFSLRALERYSLGGIMFDFHMYAPDHAAGRRSLANAWNSEDVQLRKIIEILDEAERRRPGIYRFYCSARSWPWALRHATHIHAGDPGASDLMRKAMATDYPARALTFERRVSWQTHYDNFVPPWGVKGDIAGWSIQQQSPIPANLEHADRLVCAGEGWVQNMLLCFATTAVRDVRFAFKQMPGFDRDILKQWLAWDRRRTQFIFSCRPLFQPGDDPTDGMDGFSHVGGGRGVVYLFNRSFQLAEATVRLDERAGFTPADEEVPVHIIYPIKAPLGSGVVSYDDELRVPVIGRDAVVIEVGLDPPTELESYTEYQRLARSVRRSFDTLFLTSAQELAAALDERAMHIDVGASLRDQSVATRIVETLGAAAGRRLSSQPAEADARLIIGSHEGLQAHAVIGNRFRETLYNQYVDWEGSLVSAPLVAELPNVQPSTYCLVAPRPEQLAKLAADLASALLTPMVERAAPPGASGMQQRLAFAAAVPAGRPVLRFRPTMRAQTDLPLPSDLSLVRFQIHVSDGDERRLLWTDDLPPVIHLDPNRYFPDRFLSVSDLSGREVRFEFSAGFADGRDGVKLAVGFDRIALLAMAT